MNIGNLFARIPPLVLAAFMAAGSQTLQGALTQLNGEGAKRYVSPIVSAFGANMNAGWYHKSPSAD